MSSAYIPSALRRLVCDRAKGCCEYCLISEATAFAPHEIDPIITAIAYPVLKCLSQYPQACAKNSSARQDTLFDREKMLHHNR